MLKRSIKNTLARNILDTKLAMVRKKIMKFETYEAFYDHDFDRKKEVKYDVNRFMMRQTPGQERNELGYLNLEGSGHDLKVPIMGYKLFKMFEYTVGPPGDLGI